MFEALERKVKNVPLVTAALTDKQKMLVMGQVQDGEVATLWRTSATSKEPAVCTLSRCLHGRTQPMMFFFYSPSSPAEPPLELVGLTA